MQKITRFSEAESVLAQFIPPSADAPYSLDRIKNLMAFLGNPQNKLSIIHVAGTSGKTSTSYYLAAFLRSTGRTVGLSVSPHIDSLAERAQINMELLEEADFCRELTTFLTLVEQSGIHPSYFELFVAFMYWLFEKRGVDYAVVEVGLGGLLDGTNVVDLADKVCVITDIGFDHMNILGNTLPEIAAQKAGIILPRNHVFMHTQDEEVMGVIRQTCATKQAELIVTDEALPVEYGSIPAFQKRNISLAYQVICHVLPEANDQALFKKSIESVLMTYIPARMEEVTWRGKLLVLDGSHNEQKLRALAGSMSEKYGNTPLRIVAAFGQNKSVSLNHNLRVLRGLSETITLTKFDHGQDELRAAIAPEEVATIAKEENFSDIHIETDPEKAILEAVDYPEKIILVTGSFYLLSQIRPFIFKK
jgi:dihydrofolate synthase/folylpolyglutamate synthase